MMLPDDPQPLPVLKQRFQDAVKHVYDAAKVIAEEIDRPGIKPEHVFDFEDGIRLIISRDKFKEKEVLHFSASISKRYKIPLGVSARAGIDKFLKECVAHIEELAGCHQKDIKLIAITPEKGVPHWIVELANLN